jgi:3-oxocholest-4-en-26-oyl-CoA dehydrogenase alpha subunit
VNFGTVALDDPHQRFARDVDAFLAAHVTTEILGLERDSGDGFDERLYRALGSRGWIMPRWPAEVGGAGLDPLSAHILSVKLTASRAPLNPLGTTRMVWEAIERYMPAGWVAEFRPKVAAGAVRFCLGYSDPEGGSDIAGAHLRAVRRGGTWLLNGAKMFTTGAQNCQYVFLITRTDPDAPKHRGLTMFLVPLSSPGIEIQAIRTFGGERTNAVYYTDVSVPDRYRVGAVDDGWSVLHTPLDQEHHVGQETDGLQDQSLGRAFLRHLEAAYTAALPWLAARGAEETPSAPSALCYRVGEIAMEIEAATGAPGAGGRILGAETTIRGVAALTDLVGVAAMLPRGVPGAIGDGEIEFMHRFAQGTTIYAGTTEVFRGIVARQLGLPDLDLPGRRKYLRPQTIPQR